MSIKVLSLYHITVILKDKEAIMMKRFAAFFLTTALCVSAPMASFAYDSADKGYAVQASDLNLKWEDNVIIGEITTDDSDEMGDSDTAESPGDTGDTSETGDTSDSEDTDAEDSTIPDGLYTDDDGSIYYYKNGSPITDTLKKLTIDGTKYYYYFGHNGKAYTKGYKKVTSDAGTDYYYFKSDGRAYTSGYKAVKIKGKTQYFFFRKNGKAAKDKLKTILNDGSKYKYYFKSNGRAAKTKWKTLNGKTYYFDKLGRAVTGTKTISKYYCVFDNKGVLQRKINTKGKLIALTYDDGPSIYTPSILSTLESYDSVATFFVVGSRVSTYSSYMKQAYDMGCEIGNHTYNHTILTSVSVSTINSEISKTNSAVKKVIGVSPVVMRPPGGGYNDTVKANVGMPLILWSIDTRDWATRNASSTYSAIAGKVSSGDIVLMHDLYEATAEASKKVIPYLVENGFQLVTVSELAACKSVTLQKGTAYSSIR